MNTFANHLDVTPKILADFFAEHLAATPAAVVEALIEGEHDSRAPAYTRTFKMLNEMAEEGNLSRVKQGRTVVFGTTDKAALLHMREVTGKAPKPAKKKAASKPATGAAARIGTPPKAPAKKKQAAKKASKKAPGRSSTPPPGWTPPKNEKIHARNEKIRQAYFEDGQTQTALAAEYGMSAGRVSEIVRFIDS